MTDSTYDTSPGVTWGVISGGALAPLAAVFAVEHEVLHNGDDCTGGGAPPAGTHTCAAPVIPGFTYLGGSRSETEVGAFDDLDHTFSSTSTDATVVWDEMVADGYGALMSAPGFSDPGPLEELHDTTDTLVDIGTALNSNGAGYRWIPVVGNVAVDISIPVSLKFVG